MPKRNINILILVNSLGRGGAERVASELSLNLPKNFNPTIALFADRIDYPYRGNLEILEVSPPPKSRYFVIQRIKGFFERFLKLKKVIKKAQPDVIITFSLSTSFLAVLLFKNTLITVFNTLSIKLGKGLFQKLKVKFMCQKAKKVIVDSKGIEQDLIKNFGVKDNKIKVIYNPLDAKNIVFLSQEKELDSQFEIWLKNAAPIIIAMGRLTEQKGQWHLIRAFSEVRKYLNCKLAILGEGELESYLKRLTKNLDLENDILFLGFQKNPFKYLARAAIFVSPSLWEGWPMNLMEAMACGLPVISTDCPYGPRDILAPGTESEYQTKYLEFVKYGILVPLCDRKFYSAREALTKEEKILAEAITKLLKDENLRKKYKTFSLERVKDFNIKDWINKWLEVINFKENVKPKT